MLDTKAGGADARPRPSRPLAILSLLLGAVLAAAQGGYFFQQAQRAQFEQAQTQAQAQADEWARDLWSRAQRLEDRLQRLPGEVPVQRALAQNAVSNASWCGDGRLRGVPAAADINRLSFIERDLLQRVTAGTEGPTLLTGKGGEAPSLLAAGAVSGGALIIEQDLTPWLRQLSQRLPGGAQVRLIQDGVTIAQQGQPTTIPTPQGEAHQGGFTVTLSQPPAPPPPSAWFLPGGLGVGILLLALFLPRLMTRAPDPAIAPASTPSARPRPTPRKPAAPAVAQSPRQSTLQSTLPATLFTGQGVVARADPELLARLGTAFAAWAREKGAHTLCLAGGGEPGADDVLNALRGGVLVEGLKTLDLEPCAIPLWRHTLETGASREGIYALKQGEHWRLILVIEGRELHADDLDTLRQRSAGTVAASPRPGTAVVPPNDTYIRQVRDDIVLARPLRLALAVPPVMDDLATNLFDGLGCTLVKATGVDALAQAVTTNHCHLGIAVRQYGEALTVVDSGGQTLSADRVLMLLARDLLSRHPGADVLFDVKCSRALASLIRKHGGRPVLCPANPLGLATERARLGAPLAGELSGQVFCADRWFGFADGLYAAARVLEILGLQEEDSATLFAALATGQSTPLMHLPMPGEQGQALVSALCNEGRFLGGRAATVDGLRVEFPDGWGVVRACPLRAVLEMRFEGRDTAALERVKNLFRDQLRAVSPDLALPF